MEAVKAYKGMGMEGRVARWYAANTRGFRDEFRRLARRVAESAPGPDVLEVAPGPGYFAIELANLGGHRVTALDISKTFVEIGRKNAAEAGVHVDFQQGNVAAMPFATDTFDFILCRAAFKNFNDPLGALREMYRVLKTGGQALIIDLRRDASLPEINREVDRMQLNALNRAMNRLIFRFFLLKRAYTKSGLEQLVAETRFRESSITLSGIGFELLVTK